MKQFLLALCLSSLSLFSLAQTSVTPFDASKDYLNGITYSLPKTELNIVITARCTIEKPGPFYQYAERYLATKNIITINNETWQIDNIEIKSNAIADPNRTFQVANDSRGVANNITYRNGSKYMNYFNLNVKILWHSNMCLVSNLSLLRLNLLEQLTQ